MNWLPPKNPTKWSPFALTFIDFPTIPGVASPRKKTTSTGSPKGFFSCKSRWKAVAFPLSVEFPSVEFPSVEFPSVDCPPCPFPSPRAFFVPSLFSVKSPPAMSYQSAPACALKRKQKAAPSVALTASVRTKVWMHEFASQQVAPQSIHGFNFSFYCKATKSIDRLRKIRLKLWRMAIFLKTKLFFKCL